MICSYGIDNTKIISISRFCSLRTLQLREGRTEQGDSLKHIVKTKDRKNILNFKIQVYAVRNI